MQAEYQYTNITLFSMKQPNLLKEGCNVHLDMVENGTQLIRDQNPFSKLNEKLSFLNQCEFG